MIALVVIVTLFLVLTMPHRETQSEKFDRWEREYAKKMKKQRRSV